MRGLNLLWAAMAIGAIILLIWGKSWLEIF